MLSPTAGPSQLTKQAYALGKQAASGTPVYNLSGLLQLTNHENKQWIVLSVPNALVRGVFDAMHEPGIELPPGRNGLDAHITVFRPDEIAMVGGPDRFKNDRGKAFKYTIGRLVELEPEGWSDVSKCWMLRIHSPELQELRRSYGLSSLPNEGQFDFHCTVAVRRRGVLGRNESAKAAEALHVPVAGV